MAKNIADLNLDEITEEFLYEQCVDMGEELGVDTRQGSIYRDAAAGHIIRISKFFDDLRGVDEIISLDTCSGEILDEYMRMRGLKRNPSEPTPAKYYVDFAGTTPDIGALMLCQGHFFNLDMLDGRYVITAQEKGEDMNMLPSGVPVIPDIDVDGLISATLGDLAIPGLEVEDDEHARGRLFNRISGPDENGNKSQFRTWCESVEGIGKARILPLWQGENTVGAVLISDAGGVPTKEVVDNVQEYVDPGCTGMGEGVANIGQFFTALAAEPVIINISVSLVRSREVVLAQIQEDIEEKIREYFKTISLSEYSPDVKVRYNRIGAILSDIAGVVDYENLKVNGSTNNVACSIYQIPVLGEVAIDGNLS